MMLGSTEWKKGVTLLCVSPEFTSLGLRIGTVIILTELYCPEIPLCFDISKNLLHV